METIYRDPMEKLSLYLWMANKLMQSGNKVFNNDYNIWNNQNQFLTFCKKGPLNYLEPKLNKNTLQIKLIICLFKDNSQHVKLKLKEESFIEVNLNLKIFQNYSTFSII